MNSKNEEKKFPSLEKFENYVNEKNYEKAYNELVRILKKIDSNYGAIFEIEFKAPIQLGNDNLNQYKIVNFCTKLANSITKLFIDPNFVLTEQGYRGIMPYYRWIATIFASSPYINADHILNEYNQDPEKGENLHLMTNKNAFYKFSLMYLPDSNYDINFDAIWEADPIICASLCMLIQTPRFIGTEEAFRKRHMILKWLPDKLDTLNSFDGLPTGLLHDVYMHCSYDIDENKHRIKKSVNRLIRNFLLDNNWKDRDIKEIGFKDGKPVIVVLLEHFNNAHSIYRTHSTSMLAAKDKFYLIGLGSNAVDQTGRDVFDEFHVIESENTLDQLLFIKKICDDVKPSILYMPSIGMHLATIFASNTRLAPIQAVALGHPGTTHSDFIEYVVVEDDYVGSEKCFSETLIRLPKDALPYVPSALTPKKIDYILRENPEVVNIGVASTTMKLNPYFLNALKLIRDRAKVKIHFHFALGQSTGISHPYVERFIKSYLGEDATAHSHAPYHEYLEVLRKCDMMVNPFPFGNTNGIIDMVTLGLVGICKTGNEVHEHIDEGLFKRLGLPEWLIANTVDEYIERSIRLAENHKERLELRKHIIKNNGLKTLFTGNATPMGNEFMKKLLELGKIE